MKTSFRDVENSDYHLIIEDLNEEIQQNPDFRHRIILKAIKSADSIGLKAALREFYRKTFKDL